MKKIIFMLFLVALLSGCWNKCEPVIDDKMKQNILNIHDKVNTLYKMETERKKQEEKEKDIYVRTDNDRIWFCTDKKNKLSFDGWVVIEWWLLLKNGEFEKFSFVRDDRLNKSEENWICFTENFKVWYCNDIFIQDWNIVVVGSIESEKSYRERPSCDKYNEDWYYDQSMKKENVLKSISK